MCGICGYFGIKRVLEVLGYEEIKNLSLSIEHRGRDATGIYCNSVNKIYKAPLRPKTFFEYSEQFTEFIDAIENSDAVICHNRLSTSGSPEINRNNQPFQLCDYVFAHNGVYWFDYSEYHRKITNKTKIERIADNTIDNDSYELFKILFNKNLEINEKTIVSAIENDYSLLSYAFSVYDSKNDVLYLSRDDEKPLYYLTDSKTTLIYCSESEYLKKLKKKIDLDLKLYQVKDYELIKVEKIYNKIYIDKYKIAVEYNYRYNYKYYSKTEKHKNSNRKQSDIYYQYYYNDFEYYYK